MSKRIIKAGECKPCRVLLDGVEVNYVYECRIGSKGWVKRYANPVRVNCTGEEAARVPIARGLVEVFPQ